MNGITSTLYDTDYCRMRSDRTAERAARRSGRLTGLRPASLAKPAGRAVVPHPAVENKRSN